MDKKPYDHAFTLKDFGVAEVFADGVHLVSVDASTMRLVLTASRSDAPKPGNKSPTGQKAIVSRLVMPLKGFTELYNQLDGMVRGLEAQGILVRGDGAVSPTFQ